MILLSVNAVAAVFLLLSLLLGNNKDRTGADSKTSDTELTRTTLRCRTLLFSSNLVLSLESGGTFLSETYFLSEKHFLCERYFLCETLLRSEIHFLSETHCLSEIPFLSRTHFLSETYFLSVTYFLSGGTFPSVYGLLFLILWSQIKIQQVIKTCHPAVNQLRSASQSIKCSRNICIPSKKFLILLWLKVKIG